MEPSQPEGARCPQGERPKDGGMQKESMPDVAVNVIVALTATPLSDVCSNMLVRPLSPSTSSIEDLAASPVPYVMALVCTKKKSAIRKFSAKSCAGVGSKASAMGLCRRLDDDLWAVLGSPSKAELTSLPAPSPSGFIRTPTSIASKGRRVRDSGESVAVVQSVGRRPKILRPQGFATRLSPVVHRMLSPFQSAFVNGWFILDGILNLHEIVHDLKSRNPKVVILKLDFEKAYGSQWRLLIKSEDKDNLDLLIAKFRA
ncbi:retrotransposon unclassified [Hordeum vulgare]|nr:retrotransposon unclassified [Hordeum vulgare]